MCYETSTMDSTLLVCNPTHIYTRESTTEHSGPYFWANKFKIALLNLLTRARKSGAPQELIQSFPSLSIGIHSVV